MSDSPPPKIPRWAVNERMNAAASGAVASWAAAHPQAATVLKIVLALGGGIVATWWTVAHVTSNSSPVWVWSALAGALLAGIGTAYWGYVGLVKHYQVGGIRKAAVYTYSYGLALAAVFVIVFRDSVSAVSIFAGALVGASLIFITPLMVLGFAVYRRDPDGARRIVEGASWLNKLRPTRGVTAVPRDQP